jgi:predicted Fe-Mo cluster-binding NifX family protein
MKIAVASEQNSPASPVARRFGRAAWLLVYDTRTRTFTSIANPHTDGELRGADAGIGTARLARQAKAGVVIAGEFGESAVRVMRDARICLASVGPASVARAIADFKNGRHLDC